MSSLRVLICEDEGLTILRYRASLGRLGVEVIGVVSDGEAVVETARQLLPDVVLMDIALPRLDGIEATRRIQATTPTPVVIISGYHDPAVVEAAMAAGAIDYLTKPVTDEALAAALARIRSD